VRTQFFKTIVLLFFCSVTVIFCLYIAYVSLRELRTPPRTGENRAITPTIPLKDAGETAHGWDASSMKHDDYEMCLSHEQDIPENNDSQGKFDELNREDVYFSNAQIRVSCFLRYRSHKSIMMNAALVEGDAQVMQRLREQDLRRLLEAGATRDELYCYSPGLGEPTGVLDDVFLLFRENGMTENLQERLKRLLEFDRASTKQLGSSQTETVRSQSDTDSLISTSLKRSISARVQAEQFQNAGDLANSFLMAEDSAVLYGVAHAHLVCR
jgi:hypothetical protein